MKSVIANCQYVLQFLIEKKENYKLAKMMKGGGAPKREGKMRIRAFPVSIIKFGLEFCVLS